MTKRPARTQEFLERIAEGGARCERQTDNFLAVDAPNETVAGRIQAFLEESEKLGLLEYENGCPHPGMPTNGR
jgi:hypothetical protein